MTRFRRDVLLLLLVCALTFGWRLGGLGLIDPDEPFYAQSATEMLQQGDWMTPRIFGHPQFEKPILFYCLEMASIRTFGQNEAAERLPAAVFGTLLVLLTYAFGARTVGRDAGLWSALALATGALFIGCSRMVLTDVVFATFVCGCCFACFDAMNAERPDDRKWLAAGVLAALAVLTKGPLGLLIPLLACGSAAAFARPVARPSARALAGGIAFFLLVATPWYAAMLARHGADYARAFFLHENVDRFFMAEHRTNNHVWYYPVVLIVGVLPWIPALAVSLLRLRHPIDREGPVRFLLCWIGSSLVLLTAAQSKLPTYVLFLFVPLSLLMGGTIASLAREGFRSRAERWTAVIAATVQALAIAGGLLVPQARVAAAPLAFMALGLVVVAWLIGARRVTAWAWGSAAIATVTVIALVTGASAALESELSMRPVAAALGTMGVVDAPGRDSVFASPGLVRGLVYYSGVAPRVVSLKPHPFWTDSRIPIVYGGTRIARLLRQAGTARCIVMPSDWSKLRRDIAPAIARDTVRVGNKIVLGIPTRALANVTIGYGPATPQTSGTNVR